MFQRTKPLTRSNNNDALKTDPCIETINECELLRRNDGRELEQVHTCQPSRILRTFTHFSLVHLAISSHFQLFFSFSYATVKA